MADLLSIRVVLTIAAALVFCAEAQLNAAKITQPFKIVPNNRPPLRALPVVYGARDCGGTGRFLQARHEDCENTPKTCLKRINQEFLTEVYFIANENADNLLIRVSYIPEGGQPQVVDHPAPSLYLKAGQEYVFSTTGVTFPELKGKRYTVRLELLRQKDMRREICGEGDFTAH